MTFLDLAKQLAVLKTIYTGNCICNLLGETEETSTFLINTAQDVAGLCCKGMLLDHGPLPVH